VFSGCHNTKVLFVICKDPSHSDDASILSVLLELVLVLLCNLHYMCFIYCLAVTLPNFVHGFNHYTPLLQGKLVDTLSNITILAQSSGCT